MKANKLMINDVIEHLGEWWVVIEISSAIPSSHEYFNNKEYVTIRRYGISKSVLITDITPILITKEILLDKLGFKVDEYESFIEPPEFILNCKNCNLRVNSYSNSVGKDWFLHIDNINFSTIGGGDCKYLHEIQQLVRIIADEEILKEEV